MTYALAILSLCAVACTTTQVRRVREDCPPCVIKQQEPVRAIKSEERTVVVQLPPMPAAPTPTPEEMVPSGCPPSFMRCLTAEQTATFERFIRSLKSWEKTIKGRVCQHVQCQ